MKHVDLPPNQYIVLQKLDIKEGVVTHSKKEGKRVTINFDMKELERVRTNLDVKSFVRSYQNELTK